MSGGGQKAPQGYQPAAQGQADQGYQDAASQLGATGQQLQSSVIPRYQGVSDAVINTPDYNYAQDGANTAANWATQYVAPGQMSAASALYGAGGQSANYGTSIMASQPGMAAQYAVNPYAFQVNPYGYQTSASPYQTNASPYATDLSGVNGSLGSAMPMATSGYGLAPMTLAGTLNAIGQTTGGMGAAGQVLSDAFDPQGQLYDRTYAQLMDHQNAINGQNGVAGSPFAAGVNGQVASNFGIDWQNSQLQREISGLGAYGTEQSTVANNYANLQNSGVNAYNSLVNGATNNLLGINSAIAGNTLNQNNQNFNQTLSSNNQNFNQILGANNQNFNQVLQGSGQNYNQILAGQGQNFNQANTAQNSAVANYAALQALAGTQYGQASALGAEGLNTMYAASQLPSQTYMTQQQSNIDALNAQVAGTNSSMGLTQAQLDAYGNYLKLGQGATANAQNAAQINNAASASNMAGIGKLVGTVAGVALAPFTGGASLALTAAAAK